jgi:hypothetical protein
MASILATDITIKSNNVPINGNYLEVNVIADGRCFFGSVALAYKINNKEPYTDALTNSIISNLNGWIQENLIDIVEKPPNCAIIEAIAKYARSSELAKVSEKDDGDDTTMTPARLEKERIQQEIDDTFPFYLTNCPYNGNVTEPEIQTLLTIDTFKKYHAQFINFCKSFIEKKDGAYTYAEPEVITQILSNTLNQNICVVNNNNIETIRYYSNYDEENKLPTIYVKKLSYAHYHALIPTENVPFAESTPNSLKIKYERCELKDLPSTGFRGAFASSRTNRIIGKNPSDTENVVSKVNKTISEKSDFSHFQPITENDVTLKNDKEPSTSNEHLKRASNDDFYFLVNLKEKQNSRRGGGKYTKSRLLRRLTQRKKTKRRRNKKRKSKKQH